MNLGIQAPTDNCQKDTNISDSICFCEACRANRTHTYTASQHKMDEDCRANLEPKISSKTSKPSSKLTIDPKLAKEYPFSKIPPKHKESCC